MMIPGKNTLRFQLIVVLSILFCFLIVLVGKSIKKSLESRTLSDEYTIKNNLGILVEPLNFKSLANGMQKMIHEYSQFDPKFIREDVKNRFSTTVHTQSIKKLFRTF